LKFKVSAVVDNYQISSKKIFQPFYYFAYACFIHATNISELNPQAVSSSINLVSIPSNIGTTSSTKSLKYEYVYKHSY